MKASEVMTALRICGNHPSVADKDCKDCPYREYCDLGPGSETALGLIAADTIEALMKELAEERVKNAAGGWISTEERLPEPHTPVLVARVYEKGKPLRVEQGMLTAGGWWKVYGTNVKKVLFWQPVPAAPEMAESARKGGIPHER